VKKHSFFKGVLLLTAAGIMVKFIGFIYRVVLTNLPGYGDAGNGIYGAGFQVYLILYALSTTGFPAAISKLVAEKTAVGDHRGAHRIFKVSFRILFVTGLVFSFAFFACSTYIAELISNTGTAYTMAALSPTILFVSLMAVFRGYFQGMQDMSPQGYSQIIEQLGKMVFTVLLAYMLLPYGVEMAAAGATFGTTIGAAIGAAYLWNLYNRRKKELWKNIRHSYSRRKQASVLGIVKNLLKISIPISLGAVILTAANIIDLGTVMRQLAKAGFDGDSANRLYGILTGKCYVLTHFPVAVTMALATSLVPAIAGAMALRDYKTVRNKILISLRITILIGLPSSVGMAVLAEPILKLLFPGSSDGAYLLAISAFSVIFVGLTQILSGVLQGLGRAFIPAFSLLIGAAAKVIINFTLMPLPDVNIKGAVYGTLICYIISAGVNIIALSRIFRLNLNLYDFIIKPVVATIAMGISAYYMYSYLFDATASNAISTLLTILASMAVFGASILILGGVNARDISLLPFGENISKVLTKTKLMR